VKYSFVYSFLLIGLLSACGRAPQTPVNVPAKPEVGAVPLTEQYAAATLKDYSRWLASTVVNSIRGSAFEKIASVNPANLTAQQVSSVCGFESETYQDVDQDEDSIQATFETTFVECLQDKGSYYEVKNGQISIQDSDDNDAESGFSSRATNLTFEFYERGQEGTQDSKQLTLQDNWDFSLLKEGKTGSLAYVLTMIATDHKGSGATTKGRLALAGEYQVLADANGFDRNDYDNAVIKSASGDLVINDNAAFTVTTENLQFSDTCLATPLAGKLTLSDNTHTFSLEFAGCETVNYSYNGVPVFAPAPTPAE
jgi:hypothetical protein